MIRAARPQTPVEKAADLLSWQHLGERKPLAEWLSQCLARCEEQGRRCRNRAHFPSHAPKICSAHYRIYQEIALIK